MSGIGSNNGWLEAAIAWDVCASLHRQYCKGKDALFTTRQSDFVKHAESARWRASQQPCPTAPAAPALTQGAAITAGAVDEYEQERIAFKDAHRHLELDEVPDAWGRPMFKHSHVETSWLGWIARAARAPADSVLEDADPLQGAANWLAEAHGQFCVAVLQGCLMIGYNRAKRLHDAAIAARKQGGAT